MLDIPTAVKQSPLHQRLERAGALMREASGWWVAEHFGDARAEEQAVRSQVGLFDRSATPKFEIKGKDLAEFLRSVIVGLVPEPGRACLTESGYACRLTRYHALLVLRVVACKEPPWVLAGPPANSCVHMVDRTNGYGALQVCGPAALKTLRKLTSLNLQEARFPDLSCVAGPLASVRTIVVRNDRAGLPAYDLLFSREYAEYLWDVIMEAGAEFDLRPFGRAAARSLETAQ